MKTTVVPAQITTVEDKITGSLSLSQLILLAAPIFIGSAVYIVFPPTLRFALYKIVLIVAVFFLCGLMAIRVKGKILLLWLITIGRYNLRPRFYVANKNELHLRDIAKPVQEAAEQEEAKVEQSPAMRTPQLSTADLVALEQLIASPRTNLTFKPAKKGGLSVVITEIE